MKWLDEYSVGIEEIDSQHKKLIEMFAAVEQSIQSAETWSDIHFGLVTLKECAKSHFMLEQALMRMFGYAGLAHHSATHQYFFDKLEEMEHRSLGVSTKQETIAFLCDWFKSHICNTDKEYAEYILSGAEIVRSKTSCGTDRPPQIASSWEKQLTTGNTGRSARLGFRFAASDGGI
jgi:hemerythrin